MVRARYFDRESAETSLLSQREIEIGILSPLNGPLILSRMTESVKLNPTVQVIIADLLVQVESGWNSGWNQNLDNPNRENIALTLHLILPAAFLDLHLARLTSSRDIGTRIITIAIPRCAHRASRRRVLEARRWRALFYSF